MMSVNLNDEEKGERCRCRCMEWWSTAARVIRSEVL